MRRGRARRAAQALALITLAGSTALLEPPAATAAGPLTISTPVLQQAWFWQNAYEQANPPVAQTPPSTEPTGVPAGDLAVAYTGNSDKSSSKMTALSFDVSGAPAGGSVQQFTFSLTLDTQSSATSFNTAGATIAACQPTRAWPAEMPGDYTNEPTVDCSKKVIPTVAGDTYTFKIPSIAQSWFDDQNIGVAIVADPDTTVAPFQLVFKGAKSAHGTLVYLPPLSTDGTTSSPTTSGSTSAPAAQPPAPSAGGAPNVPLPPTTTTTSGGPPPVVAPNTPVTPATRPAAAAKPASASPTASFWLAGVLLAALLLAASLVLGDPTPAPTTKSRSRLDEVLRTRPSGVLSLRSL